jgi:hypothetical protein
VRSLILCRERLNRLLLVLARQGGTETLRQLERRFGVGRWEVEQAATHGWVDIETRKPRTGRPSQIVRVCKTPSAKLPPWRIQIEREISIRHWWFALRCTHQAIKGGSNWFWRIPPYVDAYQRTYGNARSRAGARASMSRLLKHPDVKAARAWWYAKINNRVPQDEDMPATAAAIWRRLTPVKIIIRRE